MNALIAFYIGLSNNRTALKAADLDIGNPGIGGTIYLFLLTVKYLNQYYGKKFALLLTDDNVELMDDDIAIQAVGSELDAVKFCQINEIKTLVFNANIASRYADSLFVQKDISIFLWAHNTLNLKRLIIASNFDSVKHIVCVSMSQMMNMKDSPCYEKCVCINNIITEKFYNSSNITNYSKNAVVYVGALFPQKGAHNLLDIWKYVEKSIIDAELYIIGGSSVWNEFVLQDSSIPASIDYGKILLKKLKKLNNPSKVHFMGSMGWSEINELIKNFKVGIVNPSYYLRDETFCLSAIELQCHGIPVVSRQRNDGLNTTIVNGQTGFLNRKNSEIAKSIIKLLSDDDLVKKMGYQARSYAKTFFIKNEIHKWKLLCENYTEKRYKHIKFFISKDSILLLHDSCLKIIFHCQTKKIVTLIKKAFKKIIDEIKCNFIQR